MRLAQGLRGQGGRCRTTTGRGERCARAGLLADADMNGALAMRNPRVEMSVKKKGEGFEGAGTKDDGVKMEARIHHVELPPQHFPPKLKISLLCPCALRSHINVHWFTSDSSRNWLHALRLLCMKEKYNCSTLGRQKLARRGKRRPRTPT